MSIRRSRIQLEPPAEGSSTASGFGKRGTKGYQPVPPALVRRRLLQEPCDGQTCAVGCMRSGGHFGLWCACAVAPPTLCTNALPDLEASPAALRIHLEASPHVDSHVAPAGQTKAPNPLRSSGRMLSSRHSRATSACQISFSPKTQPMIWRCSQPQSALWRMRKVSLRHNHWAEDTFPAARGTHVVARHPRCVHGHVRALAFVWLEHGARRA